MVVGFPRRGAHVDKNSIVLATMYTDTRIEIMMKHSFKSPERNKARGQLAYVETTVPTTFNNVPPRINYDQIILLGSNRY